LTDAAYPLRVWRNGVVSRLKLEYVVSPPLKPVVRVSFSAAETASSRPPPP
jgi:hypothetical protein